MVLGLHSLIMNFPAPQVATPNCSAAFLSSKGVTSSNSEMTINLFLYFSTSEVLLHSKKSCCFCKCNIPDFFLFCAAKIASFLDTSKFFSINCEKLFLYYMSFRQNMVFLMLQLQLLKFFLRHNTFVVLVVTRCKGTTFVLSLQYGLQ